MAIIRSKIARQLLAEGGAPRKGFMFGSPGSAEQEASFGAQAAMNQDDYESLDQEGQAEVDQARFDAGIRSADFGNLNVSEGSDTPSFFQKGINALGTGLQNRRGQSIMDFLGRSTAPTMRGRLGLGKPGDINYVLDLLQNPDDRVYGLSNKEREIGEKLISAGIRDEFDIRNMTQSQFDTLFPGPPKGEGGDSEPIKKLRAPITEKKEEPKDEFADILKFYGARFEDGGDVRQEYGLGSIVKKATRAVKKVVKSPIGKAALLGGLAYFGPSFLAGTKFGFAGTQGPLALQRSMKAARLGRAFGEFAGGLNPLTTILGTSLLAGGLSKEDEEDEKLPTVANTDPEMKAVIDYYGQKFAQGGEVEDEMLDLGGKEMDLRGGGFVPLGEYEKKDDVPARLSKNEFVFTADAVRAAGGGSVDKGADVMYKTMKTLENKVA